MSAQVRAPARKRYPGSFLQSSRPTVWPDSSFRDRTRCPRRRRRHGRRCCCWSRCCRFSERFALLVDLDSLRSARAQIVQRLVLGGGLALARSRVFHPSRLLLVLGLRSRSQACATKHELLASPQIFSHTCERRPTPCWTPGFRARHCFSRCCTGRLVECDRRPEQEGSSRSPRQAVIPMIVNSLSCEAVEATVYRDTGWGSLDNRVFLSSFCACCLDNRSCLCRPCRCNQRLSYVSCLLGVVGVQCVGGGE